MKRFSILFLTLSAALFANTQPLHVSLDIYANQSFLNKTFSLEQSGIISSKVSSTINLKDIKFQMPSTCKIEKSTLSKNKKIVNIDIDNLLKKKNNLLYQVEAIFAKNTLLKSLSLKNINDFKKIDKLSDYLSQTLVKNLSQIDKLKKDISKIDEELKSIQINSSKYKELKIAYTCNNKNKEITISYPQKDMKYSSFYDIKANINNKSVKIDTKANIFLSGIESFSNIDINIFSYRFNQNVAPIPFYPKYLGITRAMGLKKAKTSSLMMADSAQESFAPNQVMHQELATKSVYKIKDVKLKINENNLLHVDSEVIDANFKTIIDAYGTNKAYLEARIKSKKNYLGGSAKYYLSSNPIASRYIQNIRKDKETKLYFGEDEHVQIQKELIKTLDDKTFFGDKKISTQNWKYVISNKKPFSTQISFIERVPVSKNADIKVKTLAQPQFDNQSAKGKTNWDFTLEANQSKTIFFGYEVSNSK